MTFKNIREFTEFLIETEGVTVQETNPEGSYVTIEDISNSDPLVIAEVIITAHDSGFTIGSFFADRYDGEVTFYQ